MKSQKQQRNSVQRRVVLEALKGVTSHPTAGVLHAMVRERLPKVSLGTVYRNLVLLAENGAIQKLVSGGTESRFDGNPEPHHHIRCLRCGCVADVNNVPSVPDLKNITELEGFEVVGHILEFTGICPDCRRPQRGI